MTETMFLGSVLLTLMIHHSLKSTYVGNTIGICIIVLRWLYTMRDTCDSQIKGRIANYQQTRAYTLFAVRSFPVNKFNVHFQKKGECEFFLW